MAAAYFNKFVDPAKARAVSAGTRPDGRVHPEVVKVMGEDGIDLRSARPQELTTELAAGCAPSDHGGMWRRVPVRAWPQAR
jgi:arsenate reductase